MNDIKVMDGLKFDVMHTDNAALMHCPSCGEGYTHITGVHVGGRPKEDGPFENVIVEGSKVREHVPAGLMAMPDWPNLRRDYVTLTGWCEMCHGSFGISFIQHKGQTFVQPLTNSWSAVKPGR
ncbi:hypothetical protein [Euzebya tangerina]|uniref:hypothetical protein n=1 Tax=Euzebya tangerina TaxID=591198 RepID=UPI000E30DEB2|nr:hypothetical protein [Euzebya tangerina]